MSVEERTATERVLQARERYVPRGVSTPTLVVSRRGARDLGRRRPRVPRLRRRHRLPEPRPRPGRRRRARSTSRSTATSTSASWSGSYEPYVEVCRRLDELWPGDAATKSMLLNSGAEAIENAVKIARAATGRAGVVVFDRAFHGRTNLTMAMTSKLVYKQGFGPLATDVYRAPAPYPYRGVSTEDALAGLELLFKQDVDPTRGRVHRARAGAGRGRLHPDAAGVRAGAATSSATSTGSSTSTTRCRPAAGAPAPMWAIEQLGVEPDLLVAGKTLGGGLPLAAVTGRAELMDAVHLGGLGGTFGGNPVACAAALAVLDELSAPGFRERAEQIGGAPAHAARGDRGAAAGRRRGARARLDARARARASRTADAAKAVDRGRVRARADPALVRPRRQRDPAAAAAVGDGRGARARARHPGGGTWRRRRRLAPETRRRRGRARRPPQRASAASYGDVVAVDGVDLDIAAGRVLHDARPVRLGQDDDAARDRRLRAARRRPRRARRRRRHARPRRRSATSTPSSRTTRSSRT